MEDRRLGMAESYCAWQEPVSQGFKSPPVHQSSGECEMGNSEYILEILNLLDFFQAMEGAEITDPLFFDGIKKLSEECTKCDIRSVSLKKLKLESRKSLTKEIFNKIRFSARLKIVVNGENYIFDLRRVEYSDLQKQLARFDGS